MDERRKRQTNNWGLGRAVSNRVSLLQEADRMQQEKSNGIVYNNSILYPWSNEVDILGSTVNVMM